MPQGRRRGGRRPGAWFRGAEWRRQSGSGALPFQAQVEAGGVAGVRGAVWRLQGRRFVGGCAEEHSMVAGGTRACRYCRHQDVPILQAAQAPRSRSGGAARQEARRRSPGSARPT
eukprot:1846317-Lingulodinium_polyedra.AAC.1